MYNSFLSSEITVPGNNFIKFLFHKIERSGAFISNERLDIHYDQLELTAKK